MSAFLSGYLSIYAGERAGIYFSGVMVCLGGLFMSMIEVHRNNLRRKKHRRQQSKKSYASSSGSIGTRAPSSMNGDVNLDCQSRLEAGDVSSPGSSQKVSAGEKNMILSEPGDMGYPLDFDIAENQYFLEDLIDLKNKHELTLCSEEGIADMDLPDHFLIDELEYLDNITSCNTIINHSQYFMF